MDTLTELPEMPPIESAGTAPDTAPKRGRGRPKGSTDKAPRTPRSTTRKTGSASAATLEKRLGAQLTTVGTLACLVSPADGMVIIQGVPALSAALVKLGEQNPAVRQNLERALTAGAWSGVLAAMLPIGIGMAANHGLVPSNVAEMLKAANAPAPDDKAASAS